MDTVSHSYQFGPFYLNPSRRLFRSEGKPVSLTPKAFDTLVCLVENREHVVEKADLLKSVWPDTFVGEATLTQNVFKLRQILGQDPDGHSYIVTVPKRGYQFVGKVLYSKDQPANGNDEQPATVTLGPGAEKITSENHVKSLAIMPLVDMSNDPNGEYLSEGITESTINNLSQLPGLRVVARSLVFRYQGQEIDPLEVGQKLNVDYVMVGRVLMMGNQLIAKAELVDVSNGWQLWGQQYIYDFSDIFKFEERIAKDISEKLRLSLTRKEREQLDTGSLSLESKDGGEVQKGHRSFRAGNQN